MMNGYGSWGVGAWLLMSVITLVVLALIVAGVVALNRRSHPTTPPSPAPGAGGSDALHTLDNRYARGEIDEAEYIKRRDLLKPR
jgi:putative membrane protein